MSDSDYVKSLNGCGLDLVLLSVDTLNEQQDILLYGSNILAKKKEAMTNLVNNRIPFILNVVMHRGINEDQTSAFIELLKKYNGILRGIAFATFWIPDSQMSQRSLTQYEVIELIRKDVDVNISDFIECVHFSYFFSEILRKSVGKGGRRISACYLRVYLLNLDGKLVPLGRIIDLESLNQTLKKINAKLVSGSKLNGLRVLWSLPVVFLVSELLKRKNLRQVILKQLKDLAAIVIKNQPIATAFIQNTCSISINKCFDVFNVDYAFVPLCCVSGVGNAGQMPFCLKEIKNERGSKK